MANLTVEVVNVGEVQNVPNARGGSYGKIDVLYKNHKTGKVESKSLLDFNNKDVFSFVKGTKKGDILSINLDKNAKGYWEWQSVGIGNADETTGSVAGTRETAPSARSVSSSVQAKTYETADERAKRQKLIVAQSSIGSAIATLQTGKAAVAQDEVLKAAEAYYQWVMKKQVDFSDMSDDLPQ